MVIYPGIFAYFRREEMKKTKEKSSKFIPCYQTVELSDDLIERAAKVAVEECPSNAPLVIASTALLTAPRLAFFTSRMWNPAGIKLSVSFELDNAPVAVRDRILSHMNAWGEFCNVAFVWAQSGGDVRITRGRSGYWSYLGTDIRLVDRNSPTMNLQGFSTATSEAEYKRVVRHETGHTLGCPHEQLRADIVRRLDVEKTLALFRRTQGWDDATIRANVLKPLEERSIMGSEVTDETSIMCYSLPASITIDGKPIIGGSDFSLIDKQWAARVYPKTVTPPSGAVEIIVPEAGVYVLKRA